MREIEIVDLADDDDDELSWLDGETGVAADPGEETPEERQRRAESIVRYVGGYRRQLPELEWWATMAETRYRLLPTQETRELLESKIRDLVACQVAIAHIDEVAEEIASGAVSYERGEQREFEGEYLAALDAAMGRIEDSRPNKQLAFGW